MLRAGHCGVGKGPLEQCSQGGFCWKLQVGAAITSGYEDLVPRAII